MAKIPEKMKNIAGRKSTRVAGSIVFTVLVVWFFFRACTGGIIETHVYRVGRDTTWYTVNLLGKGKNMVAFTNDLLNEISKRTHIRFELISSSSDELLSGLRHGTFDAILSNLKPSPVNHLIYDFTEPFFLTGPVLIVHKDSTVTSLEEMEGETVGIETGSSLVFRMNRFPNIIFTSYRNMRQALDDLGYNKIDGVVMGVLPAFLYTERLYSEKLKVVGKPLTDEGLRLVALNSPRSKELVKRFNKGLNQIIEDGTYTHLIEKWGLFDTIE